MGRVAAVAGDLGLVGMLLGCGGGGGGGFLAGPSRAAAGAPLLHPTPGTSSNLHSSQQ